VRGQIEKSRELGQEFLELAERENSGVLTGAGHFLQASSLFHLGRFAEARCHAELSLSQYGGPSKSVLALFAGPDVGVFGRSYRSHLSWHLGFADER